MFDLDKLFIVLPIAQKVKYRFREKSTAFHHFPSGLFLTDNMLVAYNFLGNLARIEKVKLNLRIDRD